MGVRLLPSELSGGENLNKACSQRWKDSTHKWIIGIWLVGVVVILICQLTLNSTNVIPNEYRPLWIVGMMVWVLPWFGLSLWNRRKYRILVEDVILGLKQYRGPRRYIDEN